MSQTIAVRYPVPDLDKGLDFLELLAQHPEGLGLSVLASEVDRSVSEIFRMVDCLKRRGYIATDHLSDRLVVTTRLFELAHLHPPTQQLISAALPRMRLLAREAGQSCHHTKGKVYSF